MADTSKPDTSKFINTAILGMLVGEKMINAIDTDRIQHLRLCMDKKRNKIFNANQPGQYSKKSGEIVPTCPSNTKIIDIVISTD